MPVPGYKGTVANRDRATGAKVKLRELIAKQLPMPRVLDCFAGAGVMYREIWNKVAGDYVGIELEFDKAQWLAEKRRCFLGVNNLRVLRAIELEHWNVFDLDAHGNPWEQAIVIAARRASKPGELLGFALTDGSAMKLQFGRMPNATASLADLPANLDGSFHRRDYVYERCIAGLAKRLRADVVSQWRADGKTQAAVRYGAVVFRVRNA